MLYSLVIMALLITINCRSTVTRMLHHWDGILINRKLIIHVMNENVINDEWKKRDYSIDLTGFPDNRPCFTCNNWSTSCYKWFGTRWAQSLHNEHNGSRSNEKSKFTFSSSVCVLLLPRWFVVCLATPSLLTQAIRTDTFQGYLPVFFPFYKM